jgi:DNA (cytosine-5)-methyltransferase 1
LDLSELECDASGKSSETTTAVPCSKSIGLALGNGTTCKPSRPPGQSRGGQTLSAAAPPCQRTSVAAAIQGKRTGETLWPEMFRVVQNFRPSIVLVEQPSGNAEWERKVTADLAGAGYGVSRLQRSAESSRAPHRRRRMFIVAHPVQERWKALDGQPESSTAGAVAWPAPPRGTWREAGTGRSGVDDGFPDWLERLEALGDAVVPQVAEWIGRRIVEAAT